MEQLNDNFFEDDDLEIDYNALEKIEDIRKSDEKEAQHFRFHVGMRNIKTAIAATLCAFLYAFIFSNSRCSSSALRLGAKV